MTIAGAIFVVTGALVSAGIYSQMSTTQEVIVVISPVARGGQIQRSDLAIAEVSFDPLLRPIPASQVNQIIGKYAIADLVPGTFLTQDSVGERLSPGEKQAQIGVALSIGRYPDDGLMPGDQILLVAVQSSHDIPENPMSYVGTLVSVSPTGSNAQITITVLVEASQAPTVAALAANNQLALVLVSRGP
jgi:hypothetical protein